MFRDLSEAHPDNIGRHLQAAAVFGNLWFHANHAKRLGSFRRGFKKLPASGPQNDTLAT